MEDEAALAADIFDHSLSPTNSRGAELGEGDGPTIIPEDRIKMLEETISHLNADFGSQRATFKEIYLKKEEELATERKEKDDLSVKIRNLQEDLNEAKSQVTIAQFTKENEIEVEKSRYQHDLTSMRVRFEEKLNSVRAKYEDEIQQLKATNLKLELNSEHQSHHHHHHHSTSTPNSSSSNDGPGAMFSSAVTNLARKLTPGGGGGGSNDSLLEDGNKSKQQQGQGKYAYEDAEILRSLVVQLEEEVSALKEKLRHSDDQLATVQGAQASLVKGNDALTHLFEGEDVQGVLSHFDDKLRHARSGLEAEKSSRADLEMYVAFANAQKTLLKDELDKVKLQLREVRASYEVEKKNHEELKETWEKANEHFVSTHNEYITVINQYREILTTDQLDALRSKSSSLDGSVGVVSIVETSLLKEAAPITPCQECQKYQEDSEKLRNDLLKAAKLRNEMEADWFRISHDFQSKLGSLEEQIGTYEVVLLELNTSCQQSMEGMEHTIKRLGYDRESIQRKIEKLEAENDILKGKHVAHSLQLQNEYISLPNDIMELQEMVLRLKEELISVKVGKEQIEGEFKFLKDQMRMIEEEKVSVEETLNSEIAACREKVNELSSALHKSEEDRKRLDKSAADLKNKLLASETQINKLKSQTGDWSKEKDGMQKEIHELTGRITTLRKELSNSEELQKDLISLSKSLQVNLESIRQAETEVRWQHPDDVSHCNSCRKHLTDSKEKSNCLHCGRIFCKSCISRSVRRGNRDYNVCGICHTLLAHDSAPYFSTEPPHSPD
ncbi:rab GTPase-binding effector protein 1 isoform X2 [Folsomia candida]|uniref:rab GTPase-binding effector protein 1 isoform X2 n=1 Tax=Folsomia candida TaxID=158441 RepID=UPI000B9091E1|nr:rab GTPase-binding effector protein 1 isoform X2 [Folsomia candida]